MELKTQTPEGAPRIFDLIDFKEVRVSTAFFYVIRNTIVAKSWEQSARIAFGFSIFTNKFIH